MSVFKVLFCGDVVGRSGRKAIATHVQPLREQLGLDMVIVNGENAARGFGLTKKICNDFRAQGVDVITGGDHCFDQKEVMHFIGEYDHLLRPENWADSLPGAGHRIYQIGNKQVLVIHLLLQLFVKAMPDNPFACVNRLLERYELDNHVDAIIVDVHGEASSEKMAMGHLLDGRVSLVTGSHTHVPTADMHILSGGTGYHSDAGMCGDYDSVIGFKKTISVPGFLHKVRGEKLEVAEGEATLCGTYAEIGTDGLCTRIEAVRIGGRLQPTLPKE